VGEAAAVGAELVLAADRRIQGLLSGARRAGQLAIGGDLVTGALAEGRAQLVVVARDAAAAARLASVDRAIAEGRAVVFADKAGLGQLCSSTKEPKEVAVVAVLHAGVADAVLRTYRISGPFRSEGAGADAITDASSSSRSEEAWSSSSEVR
jgi:ribosomal protein L7Ae-like RNA K-turn-binding protein